MAKLSPDQRNYLYLKAAERVGIHKPILAALYAVHEQPKVAEDETGLGISPAHRIPWERLHTIDQQIEYAANTIRSLTESLMNQGWEPRQFWDLDRGRYSEAFIQQVALGYAPAADDHKAGRLERCDFQTLWQIYLEDGQIDLEGVELPSNQAYVDEALLKLLESIPRYYTGLPYTEDALLEAFRIWQGLESRDEARASLNPAIAMPQVRIPPDPSTSHRSQESYLEERLLKFIQQVVTEYLGFPSQREALLRLVQLWRQLDSREDAIASLAEDTSPEPDLKILDPALIAFTQRIPQYYRGQTSQRNAIIAAVRLWRQLATRSEALASLGIDAEMFGDSRHNPTALKNAAAVLDRELLAFVRRVVIYYQELDPQREALLQMVQIWRGIETRTQAIESLINDLKQMNRARSGSLEAPPQPMVIVSPRPDRWTPDNIQIYAAIIPDGNFSWAEATRGGTRMPPNQATVDAIVRIAEIAQRARDRIGRPFHVTSWYRPPEINRRVGGVSNSRHIVGDAIDFYCDGLTGDRLYWLLDPWWPGGLGRYRRFPYLSHIDARNYRARWFH